METEPAFIIGKKELEENGPDSGETFCEDCRKMHVIEYHEDVISKHLLGYYQCGTETYLHSIDKKRLY